jgi:hypothetical protein
MGKKRTVKKGGGRQLKTGFEKPQAWFSSVLVDKGGIDKNQNL